jgi:anaerobic C4-dicarboxylate transporter
MNRTNLRARTVTVEQRFVAMTRQQVWIVLFLLFFCGMIGGVAVAANWLMSVMGLGVWGMAVVCLALLVALYLFFFLASKFMPGRL